MSRFIMMFVVAAMLVPCGCAKSIDGISNPNSVVLYSLDGGKNKKEHPDSAEKFHGHVVLGKIEIKDKAKIKSVIDQVQLGVRGSDGTVANCFWPRHGAIIKNGNETIDLVICYKCLQVQVWKNGTKEILATTRIPEINLDKILVANHVELAEKAN